MSDVLYLVGALSSALIGVLFLRTAIDLFRTGPGKIALVRSVGHSLKSYMNGSLPARSGASGRRVMDGWHSRVDDDGATTFLSRSRLSDDCV